MSTFARCSVLVVLGAVVAPLQAQEEPAPLPPAKEAIVVVQSSADAEGGAPALISSLSFQVDGASFSAPMVLSNGGPMMLNFGSAMNPADPNTLLNDPQIQKELELIEGQVQDVQRIQRQFAEKQRELSTTMFKGGPGGALSAAKSPELMGQFRAAMEDLRNQRKKDLEEVMLPHQRERLQQLGFHMTMQRQGVADALTQGPLAEALALSDEQKERLAQTAERLQIELREEIARLREKAKKELFAELSPTQQDKLKEMIGEGFQYDDARKQGMIKRIKP